MSEDSWPEGIRKPNPLMAQIIGMALESTGALGSIDLTDGPRPFICADCGTSDPGPVFHLKPTNYAVLIAGETFYIERHVGVRCGCAFKRNLLPAVAGEGK